MRAMSLHRLCPGVNWQAADFWRGGAMIFMPDHIHLIYAPDPDGVPSLVG
jgi:REP element-mobilizing transposase RayT